MESGSVLKGLVYGGFASCVAETVTMPVDVVKTKLQMDGSGGTAKLYSGAGDCASKLVKAEGPSALFVGLPPALVRQSTYGSLRYGLYGPIKNSMGIVPGEPVPLYKKMAAGGTAGAVASAIANPTDLMKVRLQTDGMLKDAEGNFLPKKYTGMKDGLVLTCCTAFVSGFISTVASSPFDVVKSRVMGQPMNPDGSPKLYSGMVDCFAKTAKNEGAMALYNGFWPNFGRVVPRVTIVFIVMEQLKSNFG